jgi:hypothetical protein
MKQAPVSLLFMLSISAADAQQTLDVNRDIGAANQLFTVAGQPFVKNKFSKLVEGSPFFNENFMQGAIILNRGKEYKYKLVRLTLLETQVNYIDDSCTELVATTPIQQVVLCDTIHKTDHRFVLSYFIEADKKPEIDFYELLHTGMAQLYKQHKKAMIETQQYGNATWEQKVSTDTRYFLLRNKKWLRIKKLKDLPETLSDKRKELQ